MTHKHLVHLPSLVEKLPDYAVPVTPALFSTSALDYEFAQNTPKPVAWLEFLYQLWADDKESTDTLQEWFGYCLTHDTRLQKILMILGPKRSGKGTIARVQRALIGKENVAGPTLASLSQNFGLSPLLGKSLAIVSDARLGGRTDSQIVVERLLSISGEDALTVDRKFLEPVTCKLPTRIMVLTNELPKLGDSSGALAGRIILLRLTRSFYGEEDHELTDKLLAELPGILWWAIAGWRRLRERGRFSQPQERPWNCSVSSKTCPARLPHSFVSVATWGRNLRSPATICIPPIAGGARPKARNSSTILADSAGIYAPLLPCLVCVNIGTTKVIPCGFMWESGSKKCSDPCR